MIAAKIKELKARYERIKYPLPNHGMVEIEAQIRVLEEMNKKIKEQARKGEEWTRNHENS